MRALRRRFGNSEQPVPMPTFAGLNIAPGPLYYDGNTYQIADNWHPDSYGSTYGKNSGSYYFSIPNLSEYFSSRGSSTRYDIDNAGSKVTYKGKNDWRMGTYQEWYNIFYSRNGSTVNGTSSARYAIIKLASGTISGDSNIYGGLLLFPDDVIISGKSLSGINGTTINSGVTASELQNYLDQGCRFLKTMGYYVTYNGGDWRKHTTVFSCWTTIHYSGNMYYDVHIAVDDEHYGTRVLCDDISEGGYAFFPSYLVRTAI